MKVSIIIPIYNVSRYLDDCLSSCIHQTFDNLEIICVNDGSTDNSRDIIRKYQEKDGRIKCVDKKNEGLPLARKSGIEVATGEYIFHLDGDDNLPLDAIEKMMEVAKVEDADIVVGDYLAIENDSRKVIDSSINKPLDSTAYLRYILERGSFNIWGKLIRRTLYAGNQIEVPSSIVIAEDLVACFQLAYYVQKIAPSHSICYYYYIRPTSMSKVDKRVTGYLVDRSIYAVCFIAQFYQKKNLDEALRVPMQQYLANFLFTYLCSPYPIKLHRERLLYLRGMISAEYISTIHNALKRVMLQLSLVNLNMAKHIMLAINLMMK